ncbi:nitrate ABC transporter permease [Anaerobacillus alkalilacustris]|uniref:Nitrate ABC transporter permease n=1 Tax=Anaerobacillus alkalilacustris TaxID=393763 RepID=A0A1S2LIZ6_9BACI|nr:ABC transporter permease [Anaerobacillus alkalilacustris]OIJ12083.1 nitrate ABC transporter permease [Anaerobacillus alkalilacustris]
MSTVKSVKVTSAYTKATPTKEKKNLFLVLKNDSFQRGVTIVSFFVIWQIFGMMNAHFIWFNPVYLPTPTDILQSGLRMIEQGVLWKHIWSSTSRLAVGFFLGVILAVTAGFLIVRYKWIENTLDPLVNMIGPIPPFAFLPIFIIWLGVGEVSKLTLITYSTALPMLAYTVDGIRNVNPLLIRSALSLGASQAMVFKKIILPSTLPAIFVGMRVSLAVAFSAMVVSEMIGADAGLGYMIIDSRNFFMMANMFLACALIGLLYSIFAGILTMTERRIFRWKQGTQFTDAVYKK